MAALRALLFLTYSCVSVLHFSLLLNLCSCDVSAGRPLGVDTGA